MLSLTRSLSVDGRALLQKMNVLLPLNLSQRSAKSTKTIFTLRLKDTLPFTDFQQKLPFCPHEASGILLKSSKRGRAAMNDALKFVKETVTHLFWALLLQGTAFVLLA